MTRRNRTWCSGFTVIVLCLLFGGIGVWAQFSHRPAGSCPPGADNIAAEMDIRFFVLTTDWQNVVAASGVDGWVGLPPVRRMLYGFACLTLNRNNDALAAFLSVDDPNARADWNRWTQTLVQEHPDSGVAQFLRGDAMARMGWSESALPCYSEALRLSPQLTLARVARGVAYTNLGRHQEAYDDLKTACEAQPALADAYTSLGTLILRNGWQPEDANECYEQALSVAPESVLALNGLGCVKYAMGEWEKAPAYFLRAGKKLPLPLFLGNLRAVVVALENLNLRGQENSPLFRLSDFYDWNTLRAKTMASDDVFRTFLGAPLPAEPNERTLTALNAALAVGGFYDRIKDRLDLSQASARLTDVLGDASPASGTTSDPGSSQERDNVVLRNRLILEYVYPYLIARYDQRDPGMQLTLTHGLMDQMKYKQSLSPTQIAQGQWNMDHLGRPIADALESTHLPVLGFLGKQFNDHLDFSTHTNDLALQKQGIKLDDVRPGGVQVDLSRAFLETGPSPVINWFGLLQTTSCPANSPAR